MTALPLPQPRTPVTALVVAALGVASCATYQAAPIDAEALLEELAAVRWHGVELEAKTGLGPDDLAGFALTHNADLRIARAELEVTRAELIEAGLLPEPTLSWDAMDVLSAAIVGESTTSRDFWSGLGISFQLPRPGELAARKGIALWHIEEARGQLAMAEWALARGVYLAFENLAVARRLGEQNRELLTLAESTADYFQRAREAGVATAIEAALARGEALKLKRVGLALVARERRALYDLNALLGLLPGTPLNLKNATRIKAALVQLAPLCELTSALAKMRPDLARRLAAYEGAEADLRLAIAQQFPTIGIGSGISIQPGLFSRFNRAAIASARTRRARLREEYRAALFEARHSLHAAFASWSEARTNLEFIENELIPNAEESLSLAEMAFGEGVATVVQILNVQRALVRVRTNHIEAQAQYSRAGWTLLAASGAILPRSGADFSVSPAPATTSDPVR
ncbi:MAG: TolC family protein [bacterium]|nr:TolC family protein [Planctomycetota bacterium]HIL53181.1 TolC family protein [Planctomycetota bacterium]